MLKERTGHPVRSVPQGIYRWQFIPTLGAAFFVINGVLLVVLGCNKLQQQRALRPATSHSRRL